MSTPGGVLVKGECIMRGYYDFIISTNLYYLLVHVYYYGIVCNINLGLACSLGMLLFLSTFFLVVLLTQESMQWNSEQIIGVHLFI